MNTVNNEINKKYELYVNDTKTVLRFNKLSFNIKELDKNTVNSCFSFGFTYDQLNEDSQHIRAGLKANYMYNDMGYTTRKADYTSDGILYEFDENGNKMQCLDLKVMMLEEINDIDSYISIYCDWYLINPNSYTGNMICKLQDESKSLYNAQMTQYNQLKQQIAKDLDINPNESVFSNNFRKSFNKIDWFKPYKI